MDLKDHFSEGATEDILSVFLISKSNCAFVNYKTEEACAKAVTRFHDSRFQGVRLVCRLRRSSVAAVSGVPTGPAALAGQSKEGGSVVAPSREAIDTPPDADGVDAKEVDGQDDRGSAKDKYFVVKSLTVEDLETSVRTGIWATQAHNEEALNKAFEKADNVYLIFSANKSGEYFGYARMTSPISSDPSKAIAFAPSSQTVEDADQPKAIPTPATATAPRGRVIDDSARGTIFWEAEDIESHSPSPPDSDESKEKSSSDEKKEKTKESPNTEPVASGGESDNEDENKTWGKPFNLEWISTAKVPFWKTRGLRNAWNQGREVKIARDGTELETGVGRRLVGMFGREEMGGGMPPGMMQPSPMMGFGAGRGW